MLKKTFLIMISAALLFTFAQAWSNTNSVYIVAHTSSSNLNLSAQQIRNLFMGNTTETGLTPANLTPGNKTRSIFNAQIIGMTESRIQSYWAQMRFSGRKSPPIEFDSEKQLLEYLKVTPESIGYVSDEPMLPDNLLIIYTLSE